MCLHPGVARASRASGRVASPFPPWPEGQGLAPSADGRGPSRAVALHAGEWTRPGGRTARRRAGDAGASPASGSQQSRLSHPHGGDEAVATGDRGRHANSAGVGWRAVARYRHLYGERAGRGTNKAVALTSIWWVEHLVGRFLPVGHPGLLLGRTRSTSSATESSCVRRLFPKGRTSNPQTGSLLVPRLGAWFEREGAATMSSRRPRICRVVRISSDAFPKPI